MKTPRIGWYLPVGRWLIHANWARSWDGWGQTRGDRVETWFVKFWFARTPRGDVISLALWRLLLRVGTQR